MKKEIRKITANVKGQDIDFDKVYVVNEQGVEVYNRDTEIENDINLYNVYKKSNNLLTTYEVVKLEDSMDLLKKTLL